MKAWLSTGWAMWMVLTGSPLCGQVSITSDGAAAQAVHGAILREVDDPATGNRWLLEREVEHPGGPGRLILAGSHGTKAQNGVRSAGQSLAMPVIRAGDTLTLVAHTAVMDAELQAVALAPARAGAALRVRLKTGGRIVEAVALGPGQAGWAPGSGETP